MPEKEAATPTTNKIVFSSPKSGSSNKIIITVVALVIGTLLVLSIIAFFGTKSYIEKVTETAVEQAITDKVNKDAGVPDSFPTDITVYPNSEVLDSAETGGDVTLRLKTSDSVSKASEFYKNKLNAVGWKETTAFNFSGSSTLKAKKDGKQIYIFISTDQEDKKTTILINITKT